MSPVQLPDTTRGWLRRGAPRRPAPRSGRVDDCVRDIEAADGQAGRRGSRALEPWLRGLLSAWSPRGASSPGDARLRALLATTFWARLKERKTGIVPRGGLQAPAIRARTHAERKAADSEAAANLLKGLAHGPRTEGSDDYPMVEPFDELLVNAAWVGTDTREIDYVAASIYEAGAGHRAQPPLHESSPVLALRRTVSRERQGLRNAPVGARRGITRHGSGLEGILASQIAHPHLFGVKVATDSLLYHRRPELAATRPWIEFRWSLPASGADDDRESEAVTARSWLRALTLLSCHDVLCELLPMCPALDALLVLSSGKASDAISARSVTVGLGREASPTRPIMLTEPLVARFLRNGDREPRPGIPLLRPPRPPLTRLTVSVSEDGPPDRGCHVHLDRPAGRVRLTGPFVRPAGTSGGESENAAAVPAELGSPRGADYSVPIDLAHLVDLRVALLESLAEQMLPVLDVR